MSSICLERLSAEGQTPGDLVFTVSQLRQAPFGPSDIQQPSRISALASDAEKEASLDGEKQIEEPQPQSKREEGETLSSAHTHWNGCFVLQNATGLPSVAKDRDPDSNKSRPRAVTTNGHVGQKTMDPVDDRSAQPSIWVFQSRRLIPTRRDHV